MKQVLHTFQFDREQTRVLDVSFDSFDELNFYQPSYDKSVFDRICNLYQNFTVKKYPNVFGTIIMFTLPLNEKVPFSDFDTKYGNLYTDFSIVKVAFLNNIYLRKGTLCFKDSKVKEYFEYLKGNGYLRIVKGNLHTVAILPIGYQLGYLSNQDYSLKVNSNFFVMDKWDCSSVFDEIGTSIGLCVKKGKVINPPVENREVLTVKNNKVSIEMIDIKRLSIRIDNTIYNSSNCLFVTRPKYKRSPKGGFDICVVGNQIVGTKTGGDSISLSSGIIIHLDKEISILNRNVEYLGFEDYDFALQVGNSAIVNGNRSEHFISKFYNVYKPWTTSFAPSLYPLDYDKGRAPRIILGADKDNNPHLLWIEGQGKFGYRPGIDSCGASLLESANICEQLYLYNAIHLDGGGSAQLLINNKKQLKVSDRDPNTYEEIERGVSTSLYIK